MGGLDNWLRGGFFVFAVGTAGSAVWLANNDNDGAAVTLATLTVLLCVFVFITKFKRFEGLGFKGELWEQEMEQAAELRRGLKALAELFGESVSWQMGVGQRWDSGRFEQKLAIIERTSEILSSIGVDALRIEAVQRPWHKSVMVDLARPIAEYIQAKIENRRKETGEAIHAEKRRRMAKRPGTTDMTTEEAALVEKSNDMAAAKSNVQELIWRDDYETVPSRLREFIDHCPWLLPEDRQAIYQDRAEEILDIEHYASDRTMRRPDISLN